jgi:hypothetical protein
MTEPDEDTPMGAGYEDAELADVEPVREPEAEE